MGSDSVHDDWIETYKSLITLSTEGFKFCALANGGAAVAILAYLGNVAGKIGTAPDLRGAMAAFLMGLFFCGCGLFFAYLTQLKRLNLLAERQRIQRDWRLVAAIAAMALSLIAFATGAWVAVLSFR
jgi:cytochrome bd-type quinol oxidase subunit 1